MNRATMRGALGGAGLWLALLGGAPGEAVVSVSPDAEAGSAAARPLRTYPPEMEAKIAEFLKKAREVKRKIWSERVGREIDEIAKVSPLQDEQRQALRAAGEQAAGQCLEGWVTRLDESLWRKSEQPIEFMKEQMEEVLPAVSMYAQNDFFGGFTLPLEHPAWTEALQRVLTPGQAEAWKKACAERERIVGKEIEDKLKTAIEQAKEQQRRALEAKTGPIKQILALSPEVAGKLDALVVSVAGQAAEGAAARMKKMLLEMDEPRRKEALRPNRMYLGFDEQELSRQEKSWESGLAGLLSAEDQQRLKTAREGQRARRVHALGLVMVAEMDQRVAFTAAQRAQLEPLAERLVTKERSFFPSEMQIYYSQFSAQSFRAVGKGATDEELTAMTLDAAQLRHWREATTAIDPGQRAQFIVRRPKPEEPPPDTPARALEPEEVERRISDFLEARTKVQRERVLAGMSLKAEDAQRVAGLDAEHFSHLQTAARGAADRALAGWKTSIESTVRSNIPNATPLNIRQRLESIDEYNFERNAGGEGETQKVWQGAVKAELTAPQMAAWQAELDQRQAYRDRAITTLLLTEFDRKNGLSAEQQQKLEPMISRMLADYGPDIGGIFSSSGTAWYLQGYYMFLPICGLPEAEMKAVLGKEQWERWSGSAEFSNANQYWEMAQRNHTNRLKNTK